MIQNSNPLTFSIKSDEAHVWIFDLNEPGIGSTRWEQFLSKEELIKANSYTLDRDRQNFVARRGILRNLIARYTKLDLANIKYSIDPYGKLFLPHQPLFFNISHSQNKIALAFVMHTMIGVDIEQIQYIPDFPQLIERWFSNEEKTRFSKIPQESRLEAFYYVWTQKESFLKAEGKGLTLSLQDFSVSVDPTKPEKILEINNGDPSAWRIESSNKFTHFRIAVCIGAQKRQKILWFEENNIFTQAQFHNYG